MELRVLLVALAFSVLITAVWPTSHNSDSHFSEINSQSMTKNDPDSYYDPERKDWGTHNDCIYWFNEGEFWLPVNNCNV